MVLLQSTKSTDLNTFRKQWNEGHSDERDNAVRAQYNQTTMHLENMIRSIRGSYADRALANQPDRCRKKHLGPAIDVGLQITNDLASKGTQICNFLCCIMKSESC